MRASIRGPISSPSWKANTTSAQPGRESMRCEPDWRLILQPMRRSAASASLAFVVDHWLMRRQTRHLLNQALFPHVRVAPLPREEPRLALWLWPLQASARKTTLLAIQELLLSIGHRLLAQSQW